MSGKERRGGGVLEARGRSYQTRTQWVARTYGSPEMTAVEVLGSVDELTDGRSARSTPPRWRESAHIGNPSSNACWSTRAPSILACSCGSSAAMARRAASKAAHWPRASFTSRSSCSSPGPGGPPAHVSRPSDADCASCRLVLCGRSHDHGGDFHHELLGFVREQVLSLLSRAQRVDRVVPVAVEAMGVSA
jgi:hypothetical protein